MDSVVDSLFSGEDLDLLKEDSPTPLYHQVYVLLSGHILDGTISKGTQMPTEQQLAEIFGVSRITAKRALDELADDGLVERRRGKGTHVIYHYEPEPVLAPLTGMLERLVSMGHHTKVKVLEVEHTVPPSAIAEQLGTGKDEKVHRVVRVRRTAEDNEPFAWHESWTVGMKSGFTKEDLEGRVRLEVIKENGVQLTLVEQHLGAEKVSPRVAEELQMLPGDAGLTLVRRSYTADGKLIDLLFCIYNPKRFQYRMSLGVEDYLSSDVEG